MYLIPDLASLEESMDRSVIYYIKRTYASSTQRTYRTPRDTYLAFCSVMGYCPVPASSTVLCRYASFLSRTLKYTTVKQYMNIVRLLHLEWSLPNPLSDFKLKCVLKGICRDLGSVPNRKLPIDPSILFKILSKLDMDNIGDCNIWAAALVMFYGMLRRSNVLSCKTSFDPTKHLRRDDFVFDQRGVWINIRWTKTIQYHERNLQIPLPRVTNHPLCPVNAIFRAFYVTSGVPGNGPAFYKSSKGQLQPLGPNVFVSRIREILSACGLQAERYAGHSFRRGGASWAFNSGVPVDAIRIIGDWKSQAYTAYITPTSSVLQDAISSMISNIHVINC